MVLFGRRLDLVSVLSRMQVDYFKQVNLNMVRDEKNQEIFVPLNGERLVLSYEQIDDILEIKEISIPLDLRQYNFASTLMEYVCMLAKRDKKRIRPACHQALAYLAKNPQYKSLVAED